jgi:putative phosphoesterase
MRVLIISDIHGNIQALEAVAEAARRFDAVICAGDTVNYGPSPRACIDWLREKDAVTVMGNHDLAVATDGDPKGALTQQPFALAMRDWTKAQLRASELNWLRKLPRQKTFEMGGAIWLTLHATPADPLYDYRLQPDASDQLVDKLTRDAQADVMVVGHTHLPYLRTRRKMQIVNPGSVGQPLDGNPQASYAIWDHGRITLERISYDEDGVIRELQSLPLEQRHRDALCRTLRLGRIETVR